MSRERGEPPTFRLGELAETVGGEVRGESEREISGIRHLDHAGPGDLSFFTRAAYRDQLAASHAGALLVPAALAEIDEIRKRDRVVAAEPSLALAKLIALFHPRRPPAPGIHPSAVVGEGCRIDETAHVDPYAVVGDGSRIGKRAVLHSHVVVGRDCRIGAGAELHPHVVLYDRTEIGERTILHAGVVLGADGFGYATVGGEHVKVPQVGRTVIGSEVEIGALSAIDRAVLEATRVGEGSKLDNLVQVGHNVEIGRRCILSGQAGVAGSARLGNYVVVAGQSGIAGHIEIGDGAQIAAKSAALQSIEGGRKVGGIPAFDLAKWRRAITALPRLGELMRRIRALEKRLDR